MFAAIGCQLFKVIDLCVSFSSSIPELLSMSPHTHPHTPPLSRLNHNLSPFVSSCIASACGEVSVGGCQDDWSDLDHHISASIHVCRCGHATLEGITHIDTVTNVSSNTMQPCLSVLSVLVTILSFCLSASLCPAVMSSAPPLRKSVSMSEASPVVSSCLNLCKHVSLYTWG